MDDTKKIEILDKLYVFVDLNEKEAAHPPQELPVNWRNISGLCHMSQTDLKELGWIKLDDPELSEYSYPDSWLDQLKLTVNDYFANMRWLAQTSVVKFNDNLFKLDSATVNALFHKKTLAEKDPELTFNWKTLNNVVTLSSSDIITLSNKIHDYIQACFDIEVEFIQLVNSKTTLEDILNLEHNAVWPSHILN